MRRRSIPIVVVLTFLAATARADKVSSARADKVDDFIQAEMQSQNIPGLSLAVLKDGEIIKVAGYGLANIKLKISAKPETVYRIASVSKQFVATGIMVLAQEGRLTIDDPISTYLDRTPSTWSGITIRHLLTHTSGIVREAPGFDPSRIQSDADVIATAYRLPMRFTPGAKYEYCNVGYFALAEIIRRVSGRPWSDYLTEKVFAPSGMSATRAAISKDTHSDRAVGYTDNDRLREVPDWVASRPSGAFFSTVLDLAKWDAMLYTDKILTASTRRQMWTPVKLNDGTTYPYGFGWELQSLKGRQLVHHSGGMPGWRAEFARFIDDRLTIIVLMNLDDVDIDTILHGIAALYRSQSF